MRFPSKITSSYIWVAIPVVWVIFRWYACGVDGRSLERSLYGHVITKFSRMGTLLHFLTHGALRESSAIIKVLAGCVVFRGSSWWEGFMTHACSEKYYRLFLVTYVIHTFTKRSKMWVIKKFDIFSIFLSFFLFIYLFSFISNEITKGSCKWNLPRGSVQRILKDKRK